MEAEELQCTANCVNLFLSAKKYYQHLGSNFWGIPEVTESKVARQKVCGREELKGHCFSPQTQGGWVGRRVQVRMMSLHWKGEWNAN